MPGSLSDVRTDAIFSVRDEASQALNRMYESAHRVEGELRKVDDAATRLSGNRGISDWADRTTTALHKTNTELDSTTRHVQSLKDELRDLRGKDIDVNVRGVKEALAQVITLRAALDGLSGHSTAIPSDVRESLPPGFASAFNTGSLGGGSGSRSSFGLYTGSVGGAGPGAGDAASELRGVREGITGLRDDTRENRTVLESIRDALRGAPSAGGTGGAGGGSPGASGSGGESGYGGLWSLAMSPVMWPFLGGALSSGGGLLAALGGATSAAGLGMATMLPAYAGLGAGYGAVRAGATPAIQATTSAYQMLQQQQQLTQQEPYNIQSMRLSQSQQAQMTALSNQQQLSGLSIAGEGPGTEAYAAAVGQMLVAAQLQARQNQLAVTQANQSNALAVKQAKEEWATNLQSTWGIAPGQPLALASRAQALQKQFGTTFGAGPIGSQLYSLAGGAENFAGKTGIPMLSSQVSGFMPVLQSDLGGIEHFLSSSSGKTQFKEWTEDLPTIARDLSDVAGSAVKLGGALEHDLAPETERIATDFENWLGNKDAWANSVSGVESITGSLDAARPVWQGFVGFVDELGTGFDHLLTGGGGTAAAKILDDIDQRLPGFFSYLNRGTGLLPELGHDLHDLGQIAGNVFGGTGPFSIALKLLTTLLDALDGLTKALGPTGSEIVGLSATGLLLSSRLKSGGVSSLIPFYSGGKSGSSASTTAATTEEEEEPAGASGLMSTAGGLLIPAGLVLQLLGGKSSSSTIKKGSTILGDVISGAGVGGVVSGFDPFGLALGGLGGLGVGLLSAFGGGSSTKKALKADQIGSLAQLQQFFNQTTTLKGPVTPVYGTAHLTPAEIADAQAGFPVKPTVTTTGGTAPTLGTVTGQYMSPSQINSSLAMIRSADSQRAIQLQQIYTQYQQITSEIAKQGLATARQNGLVSQQKSLLQEIAQTAPSTVNYNRWGQAASINHSALLLQLTGMAHPSASALAQRYLQVQSTTRSDQTAYNQLLGAARRYDPGGPISALANALASGNLTSVGQIGSVMEGGLSAHGHQASATALGQAFQELASPASSLSLQHQEQQALQAATGEVHGFTKALEQAEAEQRRRNTMQQGRGELGHRNLGVSGTSTATGIAAATVTEAASAHNRAAAQSAGQDISTSFSQGASSTTATTQAKQAGQTVTSSVLAAWGATSATSTAKQDGQKLTDSFLAGIENASSGGQGSAAENAMRNLGYNLAIAVSQGAAQGARAGESVISSAAASGLLGGPGTGGGGKRSAGAMRIPKNASVGEQSLLSYMNSLNSADYKYEWGGGHSTIGVASAGEPGGPAGSDTPGIGLDCSATISAVLHAAGLLNRPLVAAQLMWPGVKKYVPSAQQGRGPASDLTVYASTGHTFCVPLSAQILTRDGWKRHDEVRVGDETIGYNPITKRTEWTTIRRVIHPGRDRLLRISSRRFSVRATADHRWLIEQRRRRVAGRSHGRRWVYAEKITQDLIRGEDRIITTAPLSDGTSARGDLPLRPSLAALLAWLITDGSVWRNWPSGKVARATITQSERKFTREIRELLATEQVAYSERVKGTDVVDFRLSAADCSRLLRESRVEDEGGLVKWVLALDGAARAAFVDAALMAEGTAAPPPRGCTRKSGFRARWQSFSQNPGEVSEAVKLALQLEGIRPSTCFTRTSDNRFEDSVLGEPHVGGLTVEHDGEAEVWCVTTDLGSWTMKQDHVITITGNCELNGQFFGTGANAGGGPGWLTSMNTSGYTVWHVALGGATAGKAKSDMQRLASAARASTQTGKASVSPADVHGAVASAASVGGFPAGSIGMGGATTTSSTTVSSAHGLRPIVVQVLLNDTKLSVSDKDMRSFMSKFTKELEQAMRTVTNELDY